MGWLALVMGNALAAGCAGPPMERARQALDEEDPARAATILEEVTRANPEEPGAWLALGRARMAAGQAISAREAFERAAALAPASPGPRILVGHTHELERHYDEARLAYEQACALAPSSARPERVLGIRLLRWGRAADAIPHLTRATELDPTSASTWNALAVAQFHAGDGTSALATFAQARARFPEERDLALGHAALLVRTRELAAALAIYDAITEREPAFAAGHVGRALVLHELGRCDEALTAFRRGSEAADHAFAYEQRVIDYQNGPMQSCGRVAP